MPETSQLITFDPERDVEIRVQGVLIM